MQNKFGIRALALMLAMVMVLGLCPAASAAPAKSEATGYKTIAEYLAEQKTTFDQVDPNTEVEFIVELEDAPLTGSLPAGMKLADYLNTQKGSVQANAIENQQAVMAASIEAAADVTITNRYQVVLNGFAVRGHYADRAALESLKGVKRVTIGNVYSVPETMAAEGELITSGEMINSDAVNAEGYTGKGTFAAILDTGLNVSHEAFIGEKVQGAVITAETIAAFQGLTASGDLYKNAKVAFAYDYADGDDDVSDAQGHGTHVAGTVAANGETFVGVAPDAQLAIMKVFGDSGGAYDSDIFAALEDCVILGVDTINMSLGTSCGFTYEDEATDAVYEAVRSAGINLMVSAGNDYNSAFQNLHGTDLALAGNPDYGIVGSPSTYSAALSVASVNEALAYAAYFLLGDTRISYDENPETYLPFADLDGTYEYVRVPGVGNVNDFATVDVSGKIALVDRGEIAFTEKEQNAYDAGAIAMIVCNNSDAEETVYMQLYGLIPAVFISKAEGKLMKDAATKVVSVSTDYAGRMESPVAGEMSDFSSMGVAPDLSLKPEITAPGGNVWSTSASGGYEEMSGTSMAAPHMTGAAAVMQQYVNEAFPGMTATEKRALIDNLIMSTAVPVTDPNGISYTPRKQGAGLANISAAVHSGAYLTVNGGRPKAELGESGNGTYQFTFTVHNVSDTAKTYHVSIDAIAAQTEEANGNTYISALCRRMDASELNVTFSSETVTVAPGKTADVTVSIALTDAGKKALSAFPNGIYVEGFIRLTGDDVTALSLPYLGFYGDWADAPVFDSTMYDDESAFIAESAMAMIDYNGSGNYLGVNAITGNARAEWISYASRTAEYFLLTPMQGLLRAPKEIWYSAASDANPDEKVYVMGYENTFKSFYYSSGGFIYTDYIPWEDSWQPIGGDDVNGYYYLDDGPYTFTIKAMIDGQDEYQTSSYPVFIDNEAPHIVSHTYATIDGTPYLTIQVADNHYVMAAQLVDENFTRALSAIIAVEETELGAVTTLTFDLTEAQELGYEQCRLDLYDYAWNEYLSDLISTSSQDIEPQIVQINEYAVTANADSSNMEMHASVDPADASNKTLTWTSSDETVAKVVAVSGDTMTAEIDFVGPGSCEIRATAVNGVYGTASVTVNPADSPDEPDDPDTPVNTASLEDAINEAKGLNSGDYTPATWAALEAALDAAEAVLADPDATQEQIDAAADALNEAVEALVKRADFSSLNAAIEACEALSSDAYTSDSWAALQAALAAAKAVAADPNATQEEVNAALAQLTAAQNGLVLRGNKAQLADLAAKAALELSRLAKAVFPAELIEALEQALAKAETALADSDATPEELDAIYTELLTALNAVISYPVNDMYTDMTAGTWFYDAVDFVTRYGFMNGMGNGTFAPGSNINRAQFVVILYRLAGSPAVDVENPFTDVPEKSWFTDAVLWAYSNGITTGATATTFNPGGTLVRQNMVTFLMRFAKTMGIDTSARTDLSGYTDADQIRPYALEAMEWAVANGIISGMSQTTLGPNGLANRAQIAIIIQRFVTNFIW